MFRVIALILLFSNITMIHAQDMFKVMTYNIRYANPNDGANYWDNRREKVYDLILDHNPDIIGLQEVVKEQVNDLETNLPGYSWVGAGRDDGNEKGEYSPVFYKKDRFEILSWNTIWLSKTPDKPSTGWDAALPRIATTCTFKDLHTGQTIFFINTHFDHRGEEARKQSSELLVEKLKSSEVNYLILVGDFNYESKAEGYSIITSSLTDTYSSETLQSVVQGTYQGFEVSKDSGRRIDYIFYNNLNVLNYKVDDRNDGNYYPSDHLPVIVEFRY